LYLDFFEEQIKKPIPSFMLSNGTRLFIMLMCLLVDPNIPPVVCIEEPELGMHPDVLPLIAKMIKEASTRSQILVNTQSKEFIDEFSDMPEAVVVCEKVNGSTVMRRIDPERVKPHLEDSDLGSLWQSGFLGGNRG
jgi:predicted ATPase